ncbi:nitronate monooxygenase [Deinococcus fonticola]|uniref:nitronate monooxygenase n=1 Tax=Deinococcus fonticola TaxID=2528713 RepID=UPI001F0F37A2|nr:nitronate monooxygenase [Deinococcus fonticola]
MQDDLADTLELVRATRENTRLPLIAAGGLMTRQHVKNALAAGAGLAQCGTAFLRAHEAGTSAPYRQTLAVADAGDTTLTTSFSGRPARGLKNLMIEQVRQPLPYPYQNALTRALRAAATRQGRP